MSVIIEEALCTGCGSCVKDCPAHALRLEEGKAKVLRGCLQCGHCVAICPARAVSIPEYDMEEVEEYVPETFDLDPENFLHFVKFRRSIRSFTKKPIEKEKLLRILNAGRYTATAKNRQACTFVLVQERLEEFKTLVWEEFPTVLKNLEETEPAYAKVFGRLYEIWKENGTIPGEGNLYGQAFGEAYAAPEGSLKENPFFFDTTSFLVIASDNLLDGGLASANIENMAVAEGAGVLYSGYLMRILAASPRLLEWLGIGDKPIASCMLLGYPAVEYRRTAPRKKADIRWK